MKVIGNKKDRFLFVLLWLYFFIMVFGGAFKFSQEENAVGLSTVILLAMVILKIHITLKTIFHNKLLLTILCLLLWCIVSSAFSRLGAIAAYSGLAILFAYLLAAASAYEANLSERRVWHLVYALATSILIASTLTIIDFLNIVDIPFVNENVEAATVGGVRVEQAGGFFQRRTAMAAFYSLIVPTLLYYGIRVPNLKEKLFLFASSGVSFVALFLTQNRSGVLGIVLALFAFLVIDKSMRVGKKVRVALYCVLLLMAIILTLSLYFPSTVDVYLVKLNRYLPGGGVSGVADVSDNVIAADQSRIYFFLTVMKSLVNNPIGNGFTKILTQRYGYISPHNIITYVIWAAGVFAFLWMPVLAYQLRKALLIRALVNPRAGKSKTENPLLIFVASFQVGLLAWFINNMAHNTLNTGLAWMYLGVILNLIQSVKYKNREDDVVRGSQPVIENWQDKRLLREKRIERKR